MVQLQLNRSDRRGKTIELLWEAEDLVEGKGMGLLVSVKVTPWYACACPKLGHTL
jgi:hypothetical protein